MKLSVIIPVLNEEHALPMLLHALSKEKHVQEVIVVDGGSRDKTCEIAHASGARVVHAAQGRGQQLLAGVEVAQHSVFWFLHADTVPEPGASDALVCALQNNLDAPGGNFDVQFDSESKFATWLNGFYAWLRSHGIYYGDSAIFVRREVYERIGGISPIALMEDYDFVARLERAGPTLNVTKPSVVTSSRRFKGRRPWRIVCQWIILHAMYHCRFNGAFMARLYRSDTHAPGIGSTPDRHDKTT